MLCSFQTASKDGVRWGCRGVRCPYNQVPHLNAAGEVCFLGAETGQSQNSSVDTLLPLLLGATRGQEACVGGGDVGTPGGPIPSCTWKEAGGVEANNRRGGVCLGAGDSCGERQGGLMGIACVPGKMPMALRSLREI